MGCVAQRDSNGRLTAGRFTRSRFERQQKLRVLMAECDPPRISKMLRSLFPDDESALELTLVSTISILLPTIQLVGPEVLFSGSCGVRAGCNGDGPRGAPGGAEPAFDYVGGVARKRDCGAKA